MKKILSLALAAAMMVSAIPAAYAAENEADYTAGTQITLVGTQENQGAQWTVTVPAKMQPGQTGTVKAEGTWAADQFINVHAPQTVTLTYGAQSMDVAISWSTGNCGFSKIGSNTDTVTASAEISVADASRLFGTWEGILEYDVTLIENGDVNRDGSIDVFDVTKLSNAEASQDTENPIVGDILTYGDINGDGKIRIADVTALSQIVAGKCVPNAVNAAPAQSE